MDIQHFEWEIEIIPCDIAFFYDWKRLKWSSSHFCNVNFIQIKLHTNSLSGGCQHLDKILGEWILDKWHSLHANTHYKHEYSVVSLIYTKSGLSEFWKMLFNYLPHNPAWRSLWMQSTRYADLSKRDIRFQLTPQSIKLHETCMRQPSGRNKLGKRGNKQATKQ